MAPIVKDAENSVGVGTPTVLSAAAKNPQDATARPQPVPLEIPVTVNGARTVEASEAREPFSESTKTVLVFGNGAVVRLASAVAPGQLLFVTNEKSKREVVCQVVKSKTYRAITGYVELEFTEPAANFWGVRFPAPVAAAPVKAPVVAVSAVPAAPKPVTTAPLPSSPVPTANLEAPRLAETPKPNTPSARPPVAPEMNLPSFLAPHAPPTVAPVVPRPAAKTEPVPAATPQPPAPIVTPVPVVVEARIAAPVAALPEFPSRPGDPSTETLKQQAARLQEQLSSLLFTEAPKPHSTTPSPISAPISPVSAPVAPTTQEGAKQILDIAQIDAKPLTSPVQTKPVAPVTLPPPKPVSVTAKPAPVSIATEEVKIPAWLAPLARETDRKETEFAATPPSGGKSDVLEIPKSAFVPAQEGTYLSETVVFGGQLLGGSTEAPAAAIAEGSKKGFVIGLAAVAILGVGGAVWYGLQPGNFLASKPTRVVTSSLPANGVAPAQTPEIPSSMATANASVSPGPAGSSGPAAQPVAPQNLSAPLTGRTATPNSTASTPSAATVEAAVRNNAPVEQPKKSVLGDIYLASPNINRSHSSTDTSEAEPSIDANHSDPGSDPLAGMASNNHAEPKAPLVIGGDVKVATLIKSVPPAYPISAKNQRIAGDVQLDALIDPNGDVSTATIISGPKLLYSAALTAVKQWKYAPAQLDGKPTSMHLTVTVQFRLQ